MDNEPIDDEQNGFICHLVVIIIIKASVTSASLYSRLRDRDRMESRWSWGVQHSRPMTFPFAAAAVDMVSVVADARSNKKSEDQRKIRAERRDTTRVSLWRKEQLIVSGS